MFQQFDHLFEPVIFFDQSKKIIHFNPSFLTFIKQPPRIMRSIESINQIFESKNFDINRWLDEGFSKLELVFTPEIEVINLLNKSEIAHIVMRLFPIEINSINYLAISIHDLSIETKLYVKYRQQLEELHASHSQIIQADKLATLGEMTATISHEISNPLLIASGNSELIEAYLEAENIAPFADDLKKANNDIRESIDRIHSIIRNMKQFLWKSEDTKEYCSISDVVKNAIEWLNTSIESNNIRVETTYRTEDNVMLANKVKLEQVVINLLKNAIDVLCEYKIKDPFVSVEIYRDPIDHSLIVNIQDNGPGISEKIRANLFNPFITTKKWGEGTGLGLSISKKIIESHQGQLSLIESNSGALFQLKLPSIEGYSFTRGDKVSRGIAAKHGPRILIVDNEPQILNVMTRFLEDEGYHVIASSRPTDALRFIQKMNVALIITDLSMPDINGRELSRAAREKGHTGPILYMSGSKNTDVYNEDKKTLKISGMLVKPFSKEEVVLTIKKSLEVADG
jgi:signal transduction histidine kinase/CheY-like chemotaxis protein